MSAIALIIVAVLVPQEEETVDPVLAAFKAFEAAAEEVQLEVLKEIRTRVEQGGQASMKPYFAIREKARSELEIVPRPEPAYNDPRIYAPGMYKRRFADAGESSLVTSTYRPWESAPVFSMRIEYDFGKNAGLDAGKDPAPPDALWDLLFGYPPDADLVVAWLCKKWDFDETMDVRASHFSQVYCNLNDTCYPEITLYDAFASQEGMDMPDVDVIAYARNVLGDDSYKSPIPANRRRQRLYEKIKQGFLEYFQHRTWIDAAANVYINPEAELRPEHEPLRDRLLYAFAIDNGDVDKIRKRFKAAGSRNGFIRAIDDLIIDDEKEVEKRDAFNAKQNAARWTVAEAAYAVLREYGFLKN
jgi:hypothetical protein